MAEATAASSSPFVTTPDLSAATIVDEPVEARLEYYAYFLGSDEQRTASLIKETAIPTALYPLCLVLRYLIVKEQIRLGESSKRFNWSLKQLFAAVSSGYAAYGYHQTLKADPTLTTLSLPDSCRLQPTLEPTTRDIHLQTSLQLTLQTAWHLAQTLLLCPQPFSTPPSSLVLGYMFHHIAQSTQHISEESIQEEASETEKAMMRWILDGTRDWLAIDIDALRKAKRDRKKASAPPKDSQSSQSTAHLRAGFALLADADDE